MITVERVSYDGTPLSLEATQVIESRILRGKREKVAKVQIFSSKDSIQRELYEKRQLVLDYLYSKGYVAVVESVKDTDIMNNGWGLTPRPLENVPEKLMTKGNPLHYRGEFTEKNYRLWVYLH